ncbi:MAG: two pore domain potassium channel family protein [Bacteroidia bacterium]
MLRLIASILLLLAFYKSSAQEEPKDTLFWEDIIANYDGVDEETIFENCFVISKTCKPVGMETEGVQLKLSFVDCIIKCFPYFKKCNLSLSFYKSETKNILLCQDCTFPKFDLEDTKIDRVIILTSIISELSIFNVRLVDEFVASNIGFDFCTIDRFYTDKVEGKGVDFKYCTFNNGLEIENWKLENLEIENCNIDTVTIKESLVENMSLYGDSFLHLAHVQSSFPNSYYLYSTHIRNNFVLNSTDFPYENTFISWGVISGNKLGLYSKSYSPLNDSCIDQIDSLAFSSNYYYSELTMLYNRFTNIYKNRGNRHDLNACYVEMKELESKRLEYLYNENSTIDNWFDWKLNVFLRVFADYGTKPLKALYISFYVILTFSFFYFFFYSAWDQINRGFLVKQYRRFLFYLSSEQNLEELYSDRHKAHFQSFQAFKEEWTNKRSQLPQMFYQLGKPLYHISVGANRITQWFYRRTEILSGKWVDLPKGRKLTLSILMTFGMLVYGVYLVFIKLLNSFVLSVNAFSTLGFGEIPVKGISRYLAIIEGFIGWFLLSIFSVSLISQILQ